MLPDLLDTCNICFIQEHLLLTEYLSALNSVKSDLFQLVFLAWIVVPCYVDAHMVAVASCIVNL